MKAGLPKDLYEESDKIIGELEAGRTVKDVPAKLTVLFRPSAQPYLISGFKYDPAKLVADFPGAVLALYGETDIQVPVTDGKRLADAKPGRKHVVIEKMNHVLKRVEKTDRAVQIPVYGDPTIPLHPGVVDVLAGFLAGALKKD